MFGDIVTSYILTVLWMTSHFHITGNIGHTGTSHIHKNANSVRMTAALIKNFSHIQQGWHGKSVIYDCLVWLQAVGYTWNK